MLSDNELGLLEMLCYINPELIRQATGQIINSDTYVEMMIQQKNENVGMLLENLGFTEQILDDLVFFGEEEIPGACASGSEWASILKYLKSPVVELSRLILRDIMLNEDGTRILALCFCLPEDFSKAIVAFRGTSGEREWQDNIDGATMSDTGCQIEALDFIESLPYEKITVIGHSKGGNKAMYVAITSNKVIRCVAFDAQGFSQEFMDKYWIEIQEKGTNIIHYSLSTDYIHALLFQIPNARQVYVRENKGVDNIKQHHSPNSFFVTDVGGNLVLDEQGKPQIVITEEAEVIRKLREITSFPLKIIGEIF